MADVFISYSHKDKNYAYKISSELSRYSIDVWMDGRIDYGNEWPRIIEKNLDDCPVFIILLSTNSKNSDWVLKELAYAQRKKKIIVPLLFEGENWLILETTQYVDVRNGELPPNKYFETIQKRLCEFAEYRYLLKQIVLKLNDAVKKKKERKWEIGVFNTIYYFGSNGHPGFRCEIGNEDLLCYYDINYKPRHETIDREVSILKKIAKVTALIESLLQQMGITPSLYQQFVTEPTDLEVQEYAVRIIKAHEDHFVPINKINIKVIE